MQNMSYAEAGLLILYTFGIFAALVIASLIIADLLSPFFETEDDDIGVIGFTRRREEDVFDLEHRD